MENLRVGAPGMPIAQQTKLGWIVTGPTHDSSNANFSSTMQSHCSLIETEPISDLLRKFWEIEEIFPTSKLTTKEEECEEHILSTNYRDPAGRYVVRLPLCSEPQTTGSNHTGSHDEGA